MNIITTAKSGGLAIGSTWTHSGLGNIDRVILRVPEVICSGTSRVGLVQNSGLVQGVWVGGASGSHNEPWILSGAVCISSGEGFWLPPGSQKSLFVQGLNEIRVVGWPSGYPLSYIAETIHC